jgi:phosphoenolpyruvate carboxykinase (GTP)
MAMLPFCGYNMGDYFAHWLKMRGTIKKAPRIFMVNWFRKDGDGNFIWPGYGENMRVLKWMLDRIHGRAGGRETPVGIVPNEAELDLKGLNLPASAVHEALAVNPAEWKAELESAGEFFEKIGPTMPQELRDRRQAILKSLSGEAPARPAAAARQTPAQ